MEMLNDLAKVERNSAAQQQLVQFGLQTAVQLLAPIVPHVAEVLWQELGLGSDVLDSGWPSHDPDALVSDMMTIVVQVNGKLRAKFECPADQSGDDIKAEAEGLVTSHTDGKTIRKVIYVPGRLVNIVAN